MPDLLGAGAAWLERQRVAHLAVPVTYRRGAQEAPVLATPGRTLFEVVTSGSVLERIESRDYLIAAAELAGFGPPQRGDRIIEDRGGIRHIHEVLAPGRESHWRWSDVNRSCYRIHTKHLTTEAL